MSSPWTLPLPAIRLAEGWKRRGWGRGQEECKGRSWARLKSLAHAQALGMGGGTSKLGGNGRGEGGTLASKFRGDRPVPGDRRGAGVNVHLSGDRQVQGLGGQALELGRETLTLV